MHGNRNESTTFSHFKKESGNEEAGRFMGLAFKILLKEKKETSFVFVFAFGFSASRGML